MRTPRESFLLSGKAEAWKLVTASPSLETACDYALLEMLDEMPHNTSLDHPTDPYVGLDANARMVGARRVLEILKTISEPVKETTTKKRETLNY